MGIPVPPLVMVGGSRVVRMGIISMLSSWIDDFFFIPSLERPPPLLLLINLTASLRFILSVGAALESLPPEKSSGLLLALLCDLDWPMTMLLRERDSVRLMAL